MNEVDHGAMVVPEQPIGYVAKRSTNDHAESHRKTGTPDSSDIKDDSDDDQQLHDCNDKGVPGSDRECDSRVVNELKRERTHDLDGVCRQIRLSQSLGDLVDDYYTCRDKSHDSLRGSQEPHQMAFCSVPIGI